MKSDQRETRVFLESMAIKETLEPVEILAIQVPRVILVPKDNPVSMEQTVRTVMMELTESRVSKDKRETKDPKGLKDQ